MNLFNKLFGNKKSKKVPIEVSQSAEKAKITQEVFVNIIEGWEGKWVYAPDTNNPQGVPRNLPISWRNISGMNNMDEVDLNAIDWYKAYIIRPNDLPNEYEIQPIVSMVFNAPENRFDVTYETQDKPLDRVKTLRKRELRKEYDAVQDIEFPDESDKEFREHTMRLINQLIEQIDYIRANVPPASGTPTYPLQNATKTKAGNLTGKRNKVRTAITAIDNATTVAEVLAINAD